MKQYTTTLYLYDKICYECKEYFFRKNIKTIKNYLCWISIENFLKNFHKKNWTSVVNITTSSIFFIKKKKKIINENEYDLCLNYAKSVMIRKNLDYKDAWINLYLSSIEDIILQKISRIKNMKIFLEKMNFSKKILDNYIDILNYSVFIMIKKNYMKK